MMVDALWPAQATPLGRFHCNYAAGFLWCRLHAVQAAGKAVMAVNRRQWDLLVCTPAARGWGPLCPQVNSVQCSSGESTSRSKCVHAGRDSKGHLSGSCLLHMYSLSD